MSPHLHIIQVQRIKNSVCARSFGVNHLILTEVVLPLKIPGTPVLRGENVCPGYQLEVSFLIQPSFFFLFFF